MEETALADVNGVITPMVEARVSVLDRGFLFGDAVYEVIRVFRGVPFHLSHHLRRLAVSGEGLEFSGFPEKAEIRRRALHLLEQSGVQEGTLYIQVTRGAPESRHVFPSRDTPLTLVITVEPSASFPEDLYDKGVQVITRPEERWLRADLKTVNLIPRILARRQAREQGAWEILWIGENGHVLEGGSTNVFMVQGRTLVTPPLGERILAGVTRQEVLSIAEQEGWDVDVRSIALEEWMSADECFLTGTTTEVLGISHVDGQPIGKGIPGPVTRTFRQSLRARMESQAAAFWTD